MLLDLTMNMLLSLKMFLLNYLLEKKSSHFVVQGEKACTDLPVYWTPLEMENSPSSLYLFTREGNGRGRGRGGGRSLDLGVSGSHIGSSEQAPVLYSGLIHCTYCNKGFALFNYFLFSCLSTM